MRSLVAVSPNKAQKKKSKTVRSEEVYINFEKDDISDM